METKIRRRGFIRLAGISSLLGVLGGAVGLANKPGASRLWARLKQGD